MAEPLLTITSINDGVELILTDTAVSMKLSDTILQQAQREMQQDLQNDRDVQKGSLAARFAHFVTTAVDGLLHHTIEYSIHDIASVAYQDGGLVFTYGKKHALSFETVNRWQAGAQVVCGGRRPRVCAALCRREGTPALTDSQVGP